jgi:VanZ family protein
MTQIRNYKYSILVALAIIILSTIPVPEVKPLEEVPLIDKWVHFLMYAALSASMWLDRKLLHLPISASYFILMLLLPSLLGGLLELVQAYLTTCRSGEWLDAVADAIGAVIGTVVCYFISLIWEKKTSTQR